MAARVVAALAVLLACCWRAAAAAATPDELESYGSILNVLSEKQAAQDHCPNWLADYIKFHRQARGKPDTKYLIYTCNHEFPNKWNCGGLGDRLRGIKFCLKLAFVSGRVLLVDETKPVPLEANLMPNLLDWTTKGIAIDPKNDSTARFSWIRHLVGEANYSNMDFTPVYGPTQFIRVHTDFAYDTTIPKPPRHVDQDPMTGHFWITTGLEVPRANLLRISCIFRALFRAHPALTRHYTTALHNLFPRTRLAPLLAAPTPPRYVAVHFRAGGMATGERIKINRTDDNLSALMRSLACARARAAAHSITNPILLLTDNAALRAAISAGRLGADVITTRHRAHHIDLSFADDAAGRATALAAARTVYVDLMLLAGSQCLVVPTRSGFNNEARMWAAHSCFVSWAVDECFKLPVEHAARAALTLPLDW